ncbi:MAG TPA: hypothetical protein VFD43_02170 [Planctomycetota bacterium]|nr:hypothetical protein [Planctomycetota bacterium]
MPSSPASGPPALAGLESPLDARQGLIRVRVRDFTQLFNSLDPSPFLERDLDDDMVDYITSWAREIPRDQPLRLVIQLGQPPREQDDELVLRSAIQNHFGNAAELKQNEFRQLMRRGWRSLAIGLAALGAAILAGNLLETHGEQPLVDVVSQSVLIGGWVAMWRPLEILLYDWWPVRAERLVCERLRDAQIEMVVVS